MSSNRAAACARVSATLMASVVALALTACGGGGGGSAPVAMPAPPQTPPGPPATSSLVPDAPSLGAVFSQSALSLRPLGAGMLWRYRGKDYSVPASVRFLYTGYDNVASLTQTAGSPAVTEASTNLLRTGASNQTVRAEGNNVINVYDIELTDNILIAGHVSVELRSPVQQNDQYVVFERNGFNFGEDVDGDGRSETADLAIYRRVIAQEDLNVRGVLFAATVRVDTTTRLRLLPSSGAAPAIGDFVQSDWYATDVGIVKRSAHVVGSTRPIEIEEELVTWDGITAGIGAMEAVVLQHSPQSNAPGIPIIDVAGAVAVETNVVLFSRRDPLATPLGVRSTAVDLRGGVIASNDYATVPISSHGFLTTARLGNEAFLIGGSIVAQELQLLRFDSAGSLLSDPILGAPLPLGPPSLVDVQLSTIYSPAAAGVGNEIWIAWLRVHRLPGDIFVEELVVRPFDRLGTPLAAETIVRSGGPGQFAHPKMAANGSTVLLGFFDTIPNDGRYDYVTLSRSGSQPITGAGGQVINESMFAVRPVTSGNVSGLLWHGFSASGGGMTLKGLRIDNNGQAIRAGVGSDFNTENLPGTAFDTNGLPVFGSGVASIPLLVHKDERLYEEDERTQPISEIGEFVPGTGAWASTGRFGRSVRARQVDVFGDLVGNTFMFGFADRLLIVSSFTVSSRIAVVWRRGLE